MKFSILIVSLNAGEELKKTIDSVAKQTCQDYEIIVKDGGSTDGSLDLIQDTKQCQVVQKKDKSIYDAMNQAIELASGEYYLFLNCGDYLYDETVLEKVKDSLEQFNNQSKDELEPRVDILYGNQFERNLNTVVYAYKQITPFTCYRNIPCHQTCFYHKSLFEERGYDLSFPVRADYEHFLWSYFKKQAVTKYIDQLICSYEGAGFSETKEHLKQAKREHKIITGKYMTVAQRIKFRGILALTLQPLRTALANSKKFSGIYNKIKTALYR